MVAPWLADIGVHSAGRQGNDLSLAVAGRADALALGDKDLLDLRHASPDPPIMSLAKFRRWFDQLRFE
jgi:predicted nucleic acid-binding protein